MPAGRYNFTLEQGTDFERVLTWRDGAGNLVNLTGSNARMKIKKLDGSLILSLTTSPNANGDKVTLGGAAGTITIYISSASTVAFDFTEAKYDLEIIDTTGKVKRLIQGNVEFSREQTD
jgi:hypothetical protein